MTFDPKRFYRKLDTLLHDIDRNVAGRDWYAWILLEVVERFGDELAIENGRIYRQVADGYRLEWDFRSRTPDVEGLLVPDSYPPLGLVVDNGAYIFDSTVPGQSEALESRLGGIQSVAVLLDSHPPRILAFGLREGWDRDLLDFAMRTLRNAINHRLRLENLKNGVAQAAEIQKSLLPERAPEMAGFTVAARSIPFAQEVGGDFYDFLPHGRDALGIAVGDASGHGLGAALLARDVVTGLRMASELDLRITSTIERLNRVIARSILSTRFVSLFYGELEASGDLFYVNAGHPPPLLLGGPSPSRLPVGGMILGPLKDVAFRRGFAHLEPGHTLVIVTDGVLEREGRDGAMLGEEGLLRAAAPLAGRPAAEVLDAVFAAADRHGRGRPWSDDATALVATRHAAP